MGSSISSANQLIILVFKVLLGSLQYPFFLKNYLLLFFWLCWVFIAACGLSLVVTSGGYSSLWCAGFSLQWLLLLWSTGSRCAGFSSCGSRVLKRRLSSLGTQAQMLCGMWDLPGPGLEPVSPALAGGFLTTVPPGKSLLSVSQMNLSLLEFCNLSYKMDNCNASMYIYMDI